MRAKVLVLTLAVSLVCLQATNACSCMPRHPQSHYCDSDFVILARVKRIQHLKDDIIYKVHVRKGYKLPEKASVALKSGRLKSYREESLCGVTLKRGGLYVISGSIQSLKAHINLCGLHTPWQDLTRRQRKGFKAIYKHGCTCQICRRGLCSRRKQPDLCPMTNQCFDSEGVCMRGMSGRCSWTRNEALAKCLKGQNLPFPYGRGRKSVR